MSLFAKLFGHRMYVCMKTSLFTKNEPIPFMKAMFLEAAFRVVALTNHGNSWRNMRVPYQLSFLIILSISSYFFGKTLELDATINRFLLLSGQVVALIFFSSKLL